VGPRVGVDAPWALELVWMLRGPRVGVDAAWP
jgi:hypothetical protein